MCLTIRVLKCFLNMQHGKADISAFDKLMFKRREQEIYFQQFAIIGGSISIQYFE